MLCMMAFNMKESEWNGSMKEFNLLVWLTQLGLGVAVPLAGFVYLGIWLKNAFSLGAWVLILCVVLGLISAIGSLRSSLKAMEMMSGEKKKKEADAVSFNKHE